MTSASILVGDKQGKLRVNSTFSGNTQTNESYVHFLRSCGLWMDKGSTIVLEDGFDPDKDRAGYVWVISCSHGTSCCVDRGTTNCTFGCGFSVLFTMWLHMNDIAK